MENKYFTYYEMSRQLNVSSDFIRQALQKFKLVNSKDKPTKKSLIKKICLIVPLKARNKIERGYKQVWNINIISQIINHPIIQNELLIE